MSSTIDPLREYRARRSAGRTPEPFGAVPAGSGAGRFVVQKHAARRLHYDFRLELGGVLRSWAVPKGPSFDPAEKRLAVEVEDHPLDYADFEGVIPEGNYGAGAVIVWDGGVWLPLEDPVEGLRKGKLLFELRGYKLRGRWTLVRTKGKGKDWLLIKKPDAFAAPSAEPSQQSILSGLTLEEMRDGSRRTEEIQAELARLRAPRRRVRARDVGLMLAATREQPFSGKGWIFELKIDGYRMLLAREEDEARLFYRRGSEATFTFPDVARAVRSLPFEWLVMDGEVTVLDADGRPSFQRLQKRVQLSRPAEVARAAIELAATVYVFDLLGFGEFDLRPLPLVRRKEILRRILPRVGPLQLADHVETEGERLFEAIRGRDLEGMIAKKADSPYRAGRSDAWLKVRTEKTGDFVVVGFTLPRGSRAGLGALHLGANQDGTLAYAGRVGTGFTDGQLDALRRRLDAIRRKSSPFAGDPPAGPGHVWVEPEIVCEVRFREWTEEGLLRQPVFVRFRDDKAPADCVREGRPRAEREPPPQTEAPAPPPRTVPFSHLDKVFWPKEGYTKGDLIEYYRAVAPWLLPYLRSRPLVLTRYPDGIEGKSFFQKDAPGFVPGWVRTERMWSEHAEREIDYFVCDEEESLLYLVNLGTIPIHVWSSRVESIQHPDWCILDLDPKEAPFRHVVEIARAIRRLCESIRLECFVKTSGATGLHVLIPLGGQCTYEQSRQLAELLARVIIAELPDIATITRTIGARGGRVYIDFLQNGHGRTIVSPFSVRPLPEAPVSTPLRWSEVTARLDPRRFTIRTVPPRLRRQKEDPLLPVLTHPPDLLSALDHLRRRQPRR